MTSSTAWNVARIVNRITVNAKKKSRFSQWLKRDFEFWMVGDTGLEPVTSSM